MSDRIGVNRWQMITGIGFALIFIISIFSTAGVATTVHPEQTTGDIMIVDRTTDNETTTQKVYLGDKYGNNYSVEHSPPQTQDEYDDFQLNDMYASSNEIIPGQRIGFTFQIGENLYEPPLTIDIYDQDPPVIGGPNDFVKQYQIVQQKNNYLQTNYTIRTDYFEDDSIEVLYDYFDHKRIELDEPGTGTTVELYPELPFSDAENNVDIVEISQNLQENDAPVGDSVSLGMKSGGQLTLGKYTLNLDDPNSASTQPAIKLFIKNPPDNGEIELNNSALHDVAYPLITYTPDSGFTGTDSFTYNVTDGHLSDVETVTIDVQDEPENFEVSIDSTNSPVTEGETLSVDATFENTGEQTGSQTVGLIVDGLGVDSTPVSLAPGESTSETFSLTTESGDADEYTAQVLSGNDSATTDVTVQTQSEPDPAYFEVSIDSTNSPVTEGETLSVTAQVQNIGEQSDTQTVTLDVSGLGSDSASVDLSGGDSTSVTLAVGTSSGDAGDYTAEVSTEDDVAANPVEVLSGGGDGPNIELVSLDFPDEITVTENLPVEYTLTNTGDAEGTESFVDLLVGGTDSTIDDTDSDLTVGPGDSITGTLTFGAVQEFFSSGDAIQFSVELWDFDDSLSGTTDVAGSTGAEFELSNLQQPPALTLNGDITSSVEVTNVGTATGSAEVLQATNLQGTESSLGFVYIPSNITSLTLDPGESTTVEHTLQTFQDINNALDSNFVSGDDVATGYQLGQNLDPTEDPEPVVESQLSEEISIINSGDGPPPLPGYSNPPKDHTGDGLYEDLNGDGVVDLADVLILFDNRFYLDDGGLTQYFDFTDDGSVSLPDALTLFDERFERTPDTSERSAIQTSTDR
jgi:hypothetical protein